ncbi:beta-1,6-N-acetylglucosaminyltransferase [Exiguobacterium sp. s157]|uniref:beta-1,6-N-acetylglucosaminyltransferase n=1 Tax=Exiguobacterium sp. s157 TaxID=2751233 RepID=UPI0020373B06|nr:beta-1,6-N-acetylglucosaminyltransferase [Exiguobacterium sp. s157]
MRVSFLILCHTDENHIARLAKKLSEHENFDIYIHLDAKVDIEKFRCQLLNHKSVYFVDERYDVSWGGFSAIKATMSLIKEAIKNENYDRYVLLQGLDYPLKSNDYIYDFFKKNSDVEFIRGCNVTNSKDRYFYSRAKYYLYYDQINTFKKIFNKASFWLDLKMKSGYLYDQKKYEVYWGSAQWALTGNCINYIFDVYSNQEKFNNYFKSMFPVDELYFQTIVFNSEYFSKTSMEGPEEEKKGLVNWRNLHYFEYPDDIKVFTLNDYNFLKDRTELFCRKVNTKYSLDLLNLIDKEHINKC